MEETDRR